MKKLFIISMLILFTISKSDSGKLFDTEQKKISVKDYKQEYIEASKSFDSSFIQLKNNARILETKIKHR